MTSFSLPIKTRPLAVLAAAALVGAGAYALLAHGGPAAGAGKRHANPAFKIAGDLPRPLVPGAAQPLNLRLTNRRRFALGITKLSVAVAVDARGAKAGCAAAANFTVTRLAKDAYPIRLRARRTRTLRALGIRRVPVVVMRNLASNQDACQDVRLSFRYAGRARRWHRVGAR